MVAFKAAVGQDADDILTAQRAFIGTARSYPYRAVVVADGNVAAGGSGHTVVVQTAHYHYYPVSRMEHMKIHRYLRLRLLLYIRPRDFIKNIPRKSVPRQIMVEKRRI